MSFLEELHKPDVLDCIAHLSSDEVFTPPKLVNEILDTLPQELFKSSKTKFLDPCCKSGVFLREIAKRLIEGLKDEIPDLQERLDHIFKNQLYGLAITELTALLSRRSVYCSKDAGGEYSVSKFDDKDGNIEFKRTYHIWFKDKCMMCGASKSEYDRGEELETHAYSFIHTDGQRNKDLFMRLKEMKFDVIIGNPPYQLSTGGAQAQAIPLYHKFIQQAKNLNPRYITMIVPSRWFTGGFGLDKFREEMLNDNSLRVLHDFLDASECFPGVEIKGGVCYFLWDRDNKGQCNITTHSEGNTSSMTRTLLEPGLDIFIRYNNAVSILKKIQTFGEESLINIISSQRPFGLPTNYDDFCEEKPNSIKVYANKKVGYVKDGYVFGKNDDLVEMWKVLTPKAIGSGDSKKDWVKPLLAEKHSACTETYIVLGAFENKEQAESLISYTQTKFFHFLLTLKKNTQDALAKVYQLIPIQVWNGEWTDEKLYKKYGLTEDEIGFIESMIRPME